MTYLPGTILMLFCGLCGFVFDDPRAPSVAVALGCLVILAAEWVIFAEAHKE